MAQKMHVCMLEESLNITSLQPLTSRWRVLVDRLRQCMLPAAWHHASKRYYSEKGLDNERDRQIQSEHWMVIHPYSSLKFYWSFYIMLLYSASLLYMPFQVFIRCPDIEDSFIIFTDIMGVIAIFVNLLSAYVDEDGKKIVLDPALIAIRYFKDTFFFDVISCLPIYLILFSTDCKFPAHTLAYVLKVFRIIHINRAFDGIGEQLNWSYMLTKGGQVVLRSIFFIHWMTYINYQIAVLCIFFHDLEGNFLDWMHRFKVISKTGVEISAIDKYIANLYSVWGLCVGISVVDSNIIMIPAEQILDFIVQIAGFLFVMYAFTTLIRLMLYKHVPKYIYYGRMKEMSKYLKYKRAPPKLLRKIQLYLNYVFNGEYFHEKAIMNTLNMQIKEEINMFSCRKLVLNVPLFQELPVALINTIIFSLVQVLYMPGEVVVRQGYPGNSLYLISSGTVAVMNLDGKEVAHLKDGAYFGERALLQPGTLRTATIVALEITEIYKLGAPQFQECLQPIPRIKRRLYEEAEAILKKSELHRPV